MTPPCAACLAAVLVAGCASMEPPPVDLHPSPPAAQMTVPASPATPGAIYAAQRHRPLFEDPRARAVGDMLTVYIEESLDATQQSTTNLDRSGAASVAVPAVPLLSPLQASRLAGRLRGEMNSSVTGAADGKTTSANSFNGTISVLVRQVLPNGHLLVAGEKQIGINGNPDIVRFSGIVNPASIRAGNVISSMQVAEVRLEQRGRGDVGRIQGLGWLSRFFLSLAPV